MTVIFHRSFERNFSKLTAGEQTRFKERLVLFVKDPFNPMLGNHPLRGKYEGYRSINVGGDLRAVYKPIAPDTAVFVAVGTHSKLYEK